MCISFRKLAEKLFPEAGFLFRLQSILTTIYLQSAVTANPTFHFYTKCVPKEYHSVETYWTSCKKNYVDAWATKEVQRIFLRQFIKFLKCFASWHVGPPRCLRKHAPVKRTFGRADRTGAASAAFFKNEKQCCLERNRFVERTTNIWRVLLFRGLHWSYFLLFGITCWCQCLWISRKKTGM